MYVSLTVKWKRYVTWAQSNINLQIQ